MSEQNKLNENSTKTERVNDSRRRLAKAGLIGAPLALMVKSRSALAINNACTVSGLDSGNISQSRTGTDPCETGDYKGLTPGYWGQHPDEWAAYGYSCGSCTDGKSGPHCTYNSYGDNGTKFNDSAKGFYLDTCFFKKDDQGNYIYDGYGNWIPETMMQVVQKEGWDDQYQLGAHTVAALLNSMRFSGNFPYTPSEVIELYNTYHTSPSDALMLKNVFQTLNELGA